LHNHTIGFCCDREALDPKSAALEPPSRLLYPRRKPSATNPIQKYPTARRSFLIRAATALPKELRTSDAISRKFFAASGCRNGRNGHGSAIQGRWAAKSRTQCRVDGAFEAQSMKKDSLAWTRSDRKEYSIRPFVLASWNVPRMLRGFVRRECAQGA